MAPPRLAILTGPVRAGKTTAAARVVEAVGRRGARQGGFLSPDRLGPDGEKAGIDVLRLSDGERRTLALVGRDLGGPWVGPYSFDQAAVDWAIATFRDGVDRGDDFLTVDELGRLEFQRGEGFAPLLVDLAAGGYARALAVVRLDFAERLLATLERVEARVFEISPSGEARDRVPDLVTDWLFDS